MQLRIKNTNRGQRGVYIDGDLAFIDAGTTGTFTNASDQERDAAAAIDGLMVESSTDGKEWTSHYRPEPETITPFLAVATDADGSNMRVITLNGEWFIGAATASKQPENASGYTWSHIGSVGDTGGGSEIIGGGMEAASPVLMASEEPVPADDPTEDGAFDRAAADAIVTGNAATVNDFIATATPEQLALLAAAEADREVPRKGVMKAIEERRATPAPDPFDS